MEMSFSILFLVLVVGGLLVSIALIALIMIFVYKDAIQKEMPHPLLWALLAALVPSFVGLIIYLIVRTSYPKEIGVR